MTIDDLKQLAGRADHLTDRAVDRVAEVHQRVRRIRRRRTVSAVLAAVVLAVAVAASSSAIGGLLDASPPPAKSPSPQPTESSTPSPSADRPEDRFHPLAGTTRLTPRQTVLSYNAELKLAVAALDDPDVRVSLWETVCLVCPPCPECRTHPTFRALALTTDGYGTTTYLRPQQRNVQSITRTRGHGFLLNDELNARQRLLTPDGRLRPVQMVDERRTADDPGLVFQCDRTPTGGPAIGYDNGEAGWCVLDVKTATATALPATFIASGSSAGRPTLGQRPWGLDATVPYFYYGAWWNDHGVRRSEDLPGFGSPPDRPTGLPQLVGQVASLSQTDSPTYYHWTQWSSQVDVFVVRDRSKGLRKVASRPWLPLTRAEMAEAGHPKELGLDPRFVRTPDGGLLAWDYRSYTSRPGLTIWRAQSLTQGAFETVYQGAPRQLVDPPTRSRGLDITVHDGRIYLGTLVSDDDGRTWTEPITTWRP